MSEKNPLTREILLILIGAIISATTAFMTNYFNEKKEIKRENIQKKLELNDQISKDLGKRLFTTYELYKKRRNKDTTVANALLEYKQTKEDWNLKIYSYQSLLNYYYGPKVQSEFTSTIYSPLVQLGQMAEYDKIDPKFDKMYIKLRNKNVIFVSNIYKLTEE